MSRRDGDRVLPRLCNGQVASMARFCLYRAGYTSWDQVERASDEELLSVMGFGVGCLKVVRSCLPYIGEPVAATEQPKEHVVYVVLETMLDSPYPLAVFDSKDGADAFVEKHLGGRPSATYYYVIDILEVPMNPTEVQDG